MFIIFLVWYEIEYANMWRVVLGYGPYFSGLLLVNLPEDVVVSSDAHADTAWLLMYV